MLVAAQFNVPEELRQKIEVVPETTVALPLEEFAGSQTAAPQVKHLYYPTGKPANYKVTYYNHELFTTDSAGRRAKYSFPITSTIIDIDMLVTNDGTFGLIVIYEYQKESYLARLVKLLTGFKCVHECILPYQGVCVKTIIDDVDMPKFIPNLSRQMKNWCNVITAGTRYGHAYVLYVPITSDWTTDTRPIIRNMTDALASNHREISQNGNKQKAFIYRFNIEGKPDVIKAPIEVYVTSMAFIARSCDLLIGLSFGGIIQVGFTPSGDISTNIYQSSAPVWKLIPMLPHDDPNMNVWFWSFHGERGKSLTMVLYEGSYRVSPAQENVAMREREFRKPFFAPRFADMLAEKGASAEWVACNCLTRERRTEERTEESILRTTSTFYENEYDTSQMFFSYKDAKGSLRCGLFDLNTYYFKRLPEKPNIDGTRVKQCAFLTNLIGPVNELDSIGEIQDIYIDTASISRFQFISEDPDQQIYVCGLTVNKILIEGSYGSVVAKLESLPGAILKNIYTNLPRHALNPQEASSRLVSIGLMTAPLDVEWSRSAGNSMAQSGMLYGFTSYELLVAGAIYYDYHASVVEIIENTKDEQWTSLKTMSELLWTEAQKAKQKLDALHDVFCSETAMDLSVEQLKHLKQICIVFNGTKSIYRALHDRFRRLEARGIDPRGIIAEIDVRMSALSNLADHITCLRNLYKAKFIPLGERDAEERHSLEIAVVNRRTNLRQMSEPKSLFADQLVERMKEITPDQDFWLQQTADEWYPPAILNGVSPLIVLDYSQSLKQQFIIYYFIDIVMAKRKQVPFLDEYTAREVSWNVTEMLKGVLNIKHSDVNNILNIWKSEHNAREVKKKLEDIQNLIPSESIDKRIENLICKKLSEKEEKELKELCSYVSYGKYSYQLYLIRTQRYAEVEILPITSINSEHAKKYAELVKPIRRLKEEAFPFITHPNIPAKWSEDIVSKVKNEDTTSTENVSSIPTRSTSSLFGQAKTPRPLYNKIRKLSKDVESGHQKEEIQLDKLTSPDRTQQSELETTPKLNELDERTRETITNILRTPTSRRARAAAAAEGQTGVEVTPETQPIIAAPTSILKTPIRTITTMSPGRGRLRWDPEFVEPSLDASQLSVTSSDNNPIPIQFSSEASSTIEEQSDASDEQTFLDTVEFQEDQNEEQGNEVDDQESKDKEQETEIGEQDVQLEEQEKVEIIADKQQLETMEQIVAKAIQQAQELISSSSKKWIGEDGTEHSFEQQEDEDDASTNKNETMEVASNSTFVIEAAEPGIIQKEIVPVIGNVESSEEMEDTEIEDTFDIDANKSKPKMATLRNKPPLHRKMMSEEPEPIKLSSKRRTLSASPEKVDKTTSRRGATRALFKNEKASTSQPVETSLPRITRSRTPAKTVKTEEMPKSTPKRTRKTSIASKTAEQEEINEVEGGDTFVIDTEKFKPQKQRRKIMSEEPEPVKAKRSRRALSETLVTENEASSENKEEGVSSSQPIEPFSSLRRSSRSKTPAKIFQLEETPKIGGRRSRATSNSSNLAYEMPKEEVTKSPSRRNRSVSRITDEEMPKEEVEKSPARMTRSVSRTEKEIPREEVTKSPGRRNRSVSRVVEEEIPKEEVKKSPARRTRSVSRAIDEEVPKSPSRRARTRTPSISSKISEQEQPMRKLRSAPHSPIRDMVIEEVEEPNSPANNRATRNQVKSQEPSSSQTAKSPARRRGKAVKDAGPSALETFRAIIDARRNPRKK